MWATDAPGKGPCVGSGDQLPVQARIGRVDASAVPASPDAVSVCQHLLLCCNVYCTASSCGSLSAGWFGMRQSRAVTEFWLTTWSRAKLKSSVYYIGTGCTELRTKDGWCLPAAGGHARNTCSASVRH